jgi:hypothetical protein
MFSAAQNLRAVGFHWTQVSIGRPCGQARLCRLLLQLLLGVFGQARLTVAAESPAVTTTDMTRCDRLQRVAVTGDVTACNVLRSRGDVIRRDERAAQRAGLIARSFSALGESQLGIWSRAPSGYPIQKVTEIHNKVTEIYKKVTELEIWSWNVLSLLRSEVAYIGTGHILS